MDERTLQTIESAQVAVGETIKGARFIGTAVPLDVHAGKQGAADAVASARHEHDDAVHHGWAYRVGPVPADFAWSDDGEPVGSAGQSILRRIDAANLLNIIVVVSRWGGAERLSASDLAKGYGSAARVVLAAAKVVPFVPTTIIAIVFDYPDSGAVESVLATYRARREHADYTLSVRLVVRVETRHVEGLRAALRDATSGRAQIDRLR